MEFEHRENIVDVIIMLKKNWITLTCARNYSVILNTKI